MVACWLAFRKQCCLYVVSREMPDNTTSDLWVEKHHTDIHTSASFSSLLSAGPDIRPKEKQQYNFLWRHPFWCAEPFVANLLQRDQINTRRHSTTLTFCICRKAWLDLGGGGKGSRLSATDFQTHTPWLKSWLLDKPPVTSTSERQLSPYLVEHWSDLKTNKLLKYLETVLILRIKLIYPFWAFLKHMMFSGRSNEVWTCVGSVNT